jgi:glycosyltransferase involved in cell wall biosynthesis
MALKLLVLMPWNPFPINNGAAMRVVDTAESLSEHADLDVYAPAYKVAEYDSAGYTPAHVRFAIRYIATPVDKIIEKLPPHNIVVRTLLYFRPWHWLSILAQQEDAPDIIHAEHLFTFFNGFCLKKVWKRPLVLVLHNVEHLVVRNIYGNLAGRIAHAVLKTAIQHSDRVVCVSQDDKELLAREFRIESLDVVPNSISLQRYDASTHSRVTTNQVPNAPKESQIVFFHGVLSYPPNREAARMIVQDIAPVVLSANSAARFMLVGPNPPVMPAGSPGVTFTGAVADVAPYINSATVCIAPLDQGSGTRLKILEYMACGKAVVSTLKGAEGLDVEPERNIIIAATAADFSKQILRLLSDDRVRQSLGTEARKLVEQEYNWDVNAALYCTIYAELMGSSTATSHP